MSARSSFSEAIRKAAREDRLPVICDIKPVSPRDGDLLAGRRPADLARELEGAGACALSVVTESSHFGGSVETLREVTQATSLPVLQKDFFEQCEQVIEARDAGAAAVLLTLATMSESTAAELFACARELGLEALVETHTAEEVERALELNPALIGINNRNLRELEKDEGDVSVTEQLAPMVPESVLTVSESALVTPEDVRRAFDAGADAVLIGTALLRAKDIESALKEFVRWKESA